MRFAFQAFFALAILTGAADAAGTSNVDPEAVAALDKMGAYLRTLNSFAIKTDTLTDSVLDNGQKVQFAGNAEYKVRRPNGFAITVSDDRKVRQFLYDGKTFTVFSPRMGYYATVPAKPTIREVLAAAYDKFKIQMPLADLFRWGTDDDHRDDITSAVNVGYAKINGADADQYAFRQGKIDWQVWIQRGDKPLPLKVVITDTSDNAMPEYAAVLHWTPSASFNDATFAFNAPKGATPIKIASR
ncbi:MAG TPA: DUF2092 domain-containing protein [Rhizomicrobium sp.]